MIEISKRIAFLIIFIGLLVMKALNFNGIVDDAIMLVIGAIIGVDVISGKMAKDQPTS